MPLSIHKPPGELISDSSKKLKFKGRTIFNQSSLKSSDSSSKQLSGMSPFPLKIDASVYDVTTTNALD